ncbi:MAG TPA: ComEA family DNA-binding protein [Gaiellaceae bacterium]|jgi:competence protein ComEA
MADIVLARPRLLVGAALLLVAIVLAVRYLLPAGAASPHALPVAPHAPPPPPPVVVDVVGAVRRPGLYRLGPSSRIADAVARAGGATARADLQQVNLAAPLADGEQVVVPVRQAGAAGAAGAPPAGGTSQVSGPVHLSTATLEQLDSLPGVGPVTAQKILDYRQKHGAFHSVDELDAVSGIGPARLDQLRDLVAP